MTNSEASRNNLEVARGTLWRRLRRRRLGFHFVRPDSPELLPGQETVDFFAPSVGVGIRLADGLPEPVTHSPGTVCLIEVDAESLHKCEAQVLKGIFEACNQRERRST